MKYVNLLFFFFHTTIIYFLFNVNHVQSLRAEGLIGGEEVQSNEIKYLVTLHIDGIFKCGGGIIGEKFILTAAHCVVSKITGKFKSGHYKIVAGTIDLKAKDPSRIEIDVAEVYVPSIYNGASWTKQYPEGDIAVLKLKRSLNLKHTDVLQKLRLPTIDNKNSSDDNLYRYSIATIAGFGFDYLKIIEHENGKSEIIKKDSQRMHKAETIVIDHIACQNFWNTKVHDSNICARIINHYDNTLQGVCSGDSGSPLVYDNDMVIGIASGAVHDCNENRKPSLYTKVASYLQFIRNAENGLKINMRVKTFSSHNYFYDVY